MNHLDKNIKEKLADRTFAPSASAWERLEVQLNTTPQQKKKKGWVFFAGIAASIAVLLTLKISFFSSKDKFVQPKEILVESKIDSFSIQQNINKVFDNITVEEAVVNNVTIDAKFDEPEEKVGASKQNKKRTQLPIATVSTAEKQKVTTVTQKEATGVINKNTVTKVVKPNKNNSIKINSDDLLYAVTHSQKDVDLYYAKNNISREEVLKTIETELQKSDFNIQPETILAEVERSIGDEDFQNNFMKSLKKKVNNIATAFASRNN
ncbi:hypothetical protein N9V96_01935 [Polaribacter sp.]|nr:hypothetical protein [Polaribacter sp.]